MEEIQDVLTLRKAVQQRTDFSRRRQVPLWSPDAPKPTLVEWRSKYERAQFACGITRDEFQTGRHRHKWSGR